MDYYFDKEKFFMRPEFAIKGLVAIGGDLSVERLRFAYSHGIFPWYEEGEPIQWWCPMERFIIRPENIHISRSMKKYLKKNEIRTEVNRDFSDTMHRCRIKREFAEGTWITSDMEKAYARLASEGMAFSVDAFVDGEIAGGLYGVNLGRCFFGESMFSDKENGSKIALIALAHLLERRSYLMIDCQFHTDHLERMGGEGIDYEEYMKLLEAGLDGER
ncbi:MAG: leucyl/phenylalanyl-tRNA--protein transferase [Lachnospiraceae bacterium]|nr:leucyl/phenylalanyl-tRNA--protein transferase [Lachnospiraceae bacterium]